ncbi:MAG: sigma-70 family RNA polymerase sigma factor [Bacteroidota bacterium]
MSFSLQDYSTDDLIKMIKQSPKERERILRAICKDEKLKSGIRKIVRKFQGVSIDFDEIFNLTLVQFLKKALANDDFSIRTNLNSYLFGIANFLCLNKLKDKHNKTLTIDEEVENRSTEQSMDLQIIHQEKKMILHSILNKIGKKCREVLIMWGANYKMKEIAEKLNYSSDVVVRRKKFECMKKLSSYMKNHPKTRELFEL